MTDKNEAIDRLHAKLDVLQKRMAKDRATERDLHKKLAALLAKFTVGERVIYRGNEYEITGFASYLGDCVRYYGSQIKKDGTPSMRVVELWDTGKIVKKEG